MTDDDHQKITETVLELARRQLRENDMLDFSVLTLDARARARRYRQRRLDGLLPDASSICSARGPQSRMCRRTSLRCCSNSGGYP
jgi:hypothetical protein